MTTLTSPSAEQCALIDEVDTENGWTDDPSKVV